MTYLTGRFWDEIGRAFILLVPGCNVFRKSGELVMPSGAAKDSKEHFPDLPLLLAPKVQKRLHRDWYGIVSHAYTVGGFDFRVGLFQTKGHYSGGVNPWMLKKSCVLLSRWSDRHKRIALIINTGDLPDSRVWPHLNALSENIFVYVETPDKPVRKGVDYDAMSDDELRDYIRVHVEPQFQERTNARTGRAYSRDETERRLDLAFCNLRRISQCCRVPYDLRLVHPEGTRHAGHGDYRCSRCGRHLFQV